MSVSMPSDEVKRLRDQVKNLENRVKVYENHLYLLQNDLQFNQKSLQLEQAKHQSQITSLASLFLDVYKENRVYEEQREATILQRVNNIINLDINDYSGLSALNTTSSTSEPSLINSITLNSSTTQTGASTANASSSNTNVGNSTNSINNNNSNNTSNNNNNNNNNTNNNNNNNTNNNNNNSTSINNDGANNGSILGSRLGNTDHLLSPGSLQTSQHHQLQQMHQQNQMSSLQQSFQQQLQNQQQQQSQSLQNRVNHQHLLSGPSLAQMNGPQSQSGESHTPNKTQQQQHRNNKRKLEQLQPQPDHHSSILDETLGYGSQRNVPLIPISSASQQLLPSSINNTLQSQATSNNQDLSGSEMPKRRKVYDKEYSFIKAPSSVEEVWNEYSIGLNNQPSIKSLEMEYKTGWRRDPATSKKFNRRKAIYHAVEKGMSKGYTADDCIRLMEDFRVIDPDKNSKQPIGWLCSGNLPKELT